MAAAHTRVAIPVDTVWTAVHTASGTKTLTVSNIGNGGLKLRIDASGATSDDLSTSGYLILNPGDRISFGVVSGDKVLAVPEHQIDGAVGLLVQ